MSRYRKSMSETLVQVDEIAKTIPEVAPPGWGHTVAKKEKTKPNKPKSKIGGTAHEFQKDLDSGKFKGLPGDKTYKDKKASMFKLMWSMKKKGDKPHYKPGVKDKLKSQYKEEVELHEEPPPSDAARKRAKDPEFWKWLKRERGKSNGGKHKVLQSPMQKALGSEYVPQGTELDELYILYLEDAIVEMRDAVEGFFSGKTKGRVYKSFLDDPAVRKITGRKSLADIAKKKKEQETKKEAKSHSEFPADSWKTHRPDDKAVPGRTKTVVKARRKDKNYIDRPLKKEAFGLPPSTIADKDLGDKINKEHEREQKRRAKVDAKRGRKVRKEGRYAHAGSDPRIGGSSSVDTVPDFAIKAKKGATSAPGSGSIAKAKKAKASDVNKSIEQQMADALKEAGGKWRENFKKQAAKRRGEANRRREAERDSPGQRIPSAKDDVKDLLDPHRKYKALKKSLRGEDTNRYWHSIKEAQWKVKLRGLPTFYVPGKSAGAVRQMLRKQLKRPMDDIEDITRATPAAKKKDFRDRAQGNSDTVVSGKNK